MIKLVTTAILVPAVFSIFDATYEFQQQMPQPLILSESPQFVRTRNAISILKGPASLTRDVYAAATSKGLNPVLFAVLIQTESEFKITAKSHKGYRGLAQTPTAMMRTGYELVDLTLGACILDEKIKIAKGDLQLGLALYKGGNNPAAHKYARQVLTLYNKVNNELDKKEENRLHKG